MTVAPKNMAPYPKTPMESAPIFLMETHENKNWKHESMQCCVTHCIICNIQVQDWGKWRKQVTGTIATLTYIHKQIPTVCSDVGFYF